MWKCCQLALGLLALVAALASRAPAAAQGGWAPPFDVSGAGLGWFADLAIGPSGSVHVIWYRGTASGKGAERAIVDLLMYRRLERGTWSPPNDVAVAGTGGYTVRNSVAFGPDGRLHVLLRNTTRVVQISAPWDAAWSAHGWSAPRAISGAGAAYYSALAIDGRGVLHALWSEAIPDDPQKPRAECPSCSDLFYRRSGDGGDSWSPPVNLSQSSDGENRPQILVDRRGRLHAVWDEGADWYAGAGIPAAGVYRRSDDGGASWSAPVRFRVASGAVQQTALALTGDGDPLVVYRGVHDDRLYMQRSADGGATWGAPSQIPGVRARDLNDNNLDRYSLATDGAGHVHLLMVGFPPGAASGTPQLLHLAWDGAAWSAASVVMDQPTLYPEWPRIAVAGGNRLHAVWFTRNREALFASDSKLARYQVWYSTRAFDAPALGDPPLFTPTPTSAPAPTAAAPTPAPTPTPLPLALAQAPLAGGPPAWELPGLLTVALALLPSIGLLALVAGLARRSRR